MNCPEHLLFKVRGIYVWLYWRDVPRNTIPMSIWLNPLRYEVCGRAFGRHFRINRRGLRGQRLAYAVNRLACRVFGHRPLHRGLFCPRCKAIQEQTP